VTSDIARSIAMATGGVLAFAPIEYALTLYAYSGPTAIASKLRLIALVATLSAFLWLVLLGGLVLATAGSRLVRARFDPGAAGAPGVFAVAPPVAGVRPGVPRVWGGLVTALVYLLAVQRAAVWAVTHFKEPQLTAALIAGLVLGLAVIALAVHRVALAGAHVAAGALAMLGPYNPLGRWRACGVALAALVIAGLAACWYLVPQARSYLPVRLAISGVVIALGMGLGRKYLVRRPDTERSRRGALGLSGGAFALMFVTLVHWGGEPETKYLAITGSPALDRLVGLVRLLNDLDGDGFGSLLGENDCGPWDPKIHPGDAIDHPDDGIDQNCDGRDFTLAALEVPTGPIVPVPDAFRDRDWNFLFITIDTVRYDRTSFGGYATGPKRRDTTPNLAKLVARSSNFVYAQAPSAGTMASIPAILTSKYFHSGIALDENRPPGSPPGILPENTLVTELLRDHGYRTGVIGSHEWWTGWGLDQGVDPKDYDNSIGAKPDPKRVVADKITDHALAWISRQQGKKWFLWAHYIDPHGHYMPHPEVADWGSSDPDLYDAELAWTDQQVGRLLDELARLPSHANTIVIITSDHGENMGEHNGTIGTHGYALYREQIHVPLIVFVPGNPARSIRGAVSNLDVVPTIAAIVGIDVSHLGLEGRSLVPQIFYGQEDRERIVFAETNAPKQRAAISERYKLIYYFTSNLYELFDTSVDPEEKTNLAPRDPPALATMRRALHDWIERVMYVRDPVFNQAYRPTADVILRGPPAPPVATVDQTIAGESGKLSILGIGPAAGKPWRPGARGDIHIYFRVDEPIASRYKLGLVLWQATPPGSAGDPVPPGNVRRGPARITADGAYGTDLWRKGEYIRERFPFDVPKDWSGGVAVGLVVVDATTRQPLRAVGPAPPNEPTVHYLGVIPLGSQSVPGP
jgi:choline-sulfatase